MHKLYWVTFEGVAIRDSTPDGLLELLIASSDTWKDKDNVRSEVYSVAVKNPVGKVVGPSCHSV